MRKNHEHVDEDQTDGEVLGRRALLRRAGTIAAIAGGAAVVQATGTGSAEAAAGDNVILGAANTAGTTATSVTSSVTSGTTLTLSNTGTARGPLALTKSPDGILDSTTKVDGELFTEGDFTDLRYVDESSQPEGALVFTESTANQVIGINPTRMLDTRDSNGPGGANIIDTSVLNASGQLLKGKWLHLDLLPLAIFFDSAFINLTAVAPSAVGFLTVAPAPTGTGVQPSTSSLNYSRAVTLANGCVAPTNDGSIWIYTSSTVHILVDVTALNMPSSNFFTPAVVGLQERATRKAAFAARRQARLARS
jgi:hypothetical protein